MNVEKIIRVLGYAVYTILWSPIIILALTIAPIMALGIGLRNGCGVKESMKTYVELLKRSVEHDSNFIKTGEW